MTGILLLTCEYVEVKVYESILDILNKYIFDAKSCEKTGSAQVNKFMTGHDWGYVLRITKLTF